MRSSATREVPRQVEGVATRRPYVVVHVAVSVDGATTGFEPDVHRFYALARMWREDVTLVGADTILAQEEALSAVPRPGPASDGPLLAVVDGRGRVREWEALRDCGSWSGVLALRAGATHARAGDTPVPELVTGTERVDLAAALDVLGDRGAEVVRVDSGGSLIGALHRAGLVDELSLLVHPCVTGAAGDGRWHGSAPAPALTLERLACEPFDDGLVWLRYRIVTDGVAVSSPR
jgi:2,5-diamino-6-(ribosylamino)-4(3H)-pyrimidinone 5'-phosphate reductase